MAIVALMLLCYYNINLTYSSIKRLIDEQLAASLASLEKQVQLSDDITRVVMGAFDKKNLGLARALADILETKLAAAQQNHPNDSTSSLYPNLADMKEIADALAVSETVFIDSDGVIASSSNTDYLGYEMRSHPQSQVFDTLLDNKTKEIVQAPQPNGAQGLWYQYIGVPLKNRRAYVQVGNDLEHIQVIKDAIAIQRNIEVMASDQGSYLLIVKDGHVLAYPDRKRVGQDVGQEAWFSRILQGDGYDRLNVFGRDYHAAFTTRPADGITLVSMLPQSSYDQKLNIIRNSGALILALAAISLTALWLIINRLNRATLEANQANQAKGVFLANMSHEIRTPLNGIIGFAELAMNDRKAPLRTKEYLTKIKTSADGLLHIINDILDISKIEAGSMELEKIPFDLQGVFEQCETVVGPKAMEKGLILKLEAASIPGKLLVGDPTRLRQALINLLSNAVKFTAAGTVSATAHIAHQDENAVGISFLVDDTGIGMAQEQIQKIFAPFTQADSSISRKYGGTGLGLPITKNLVELMDGQLSVVSSPGSGSRFTFTIPFTTIADTVTSTSRRLTVHPVPQPYFKGTVLVCEDNSINQEVIVEHLLRLGLKTELAANGLDGVNMVRKNQEKSQPYDLIFMDIHMPVMDGVEAARRILALGCRTPIIALTANVMVHDRESYLKQGMRSCLSKPFQSQELWECLLQYLTPVPPPPETGLYDKVGADHQAGAAKEAAGENEKVRKPESDTDTKILDTKLGLERSAGNTRLYDRLLSNFMKDNKNIGVELNAALNKGDVRYAHRLAHTLKGVAGMIGALRLAETAAGLEAALAKDDATDTASERLRTVEDELAAVMQELGHMSSPAEGAGSKGAGAEGNETKELDPERARKLSVRLRALLASGDVESMNMLPEVEEVFGDSPEGRELLSQIEGFDFQDALETLKKLDKP